MRIAVLCLASIVVMTASARVLDRPAYLTPSVQVVGLYDSRDESDHGAKVVLPAVAAALTTLGLSFVPLDLAAGLPSAEIMRGTGAIITAFTDSRMVAPLAYIAWLEAQLGAGKRLVILGNLGAFQDEDTKVWTDNGDVNRVYRRLGTLFSGQWTDRPDLLRLIGIPTDGIVVGPVDVAAAAHYFMIRPLDRDVKSHVLVERTDLPDSGSAVVFTSNGGGAILDRYNASADGKPIVALGPFLEAALFPATGTRLLIVVDPEATTARRMEDNLGWILRYSRLQADFVAFSDLRFLSRRALRAYGTMVLATNGAGKLTSETARDIEAWVKDGGGLVAAAPDRRPDWNGMMGISKAGRATVSITGVRYTGKFFPGLDGMLVASVDEVSKEPGVIGHVVPVRLTADTSVLAVAADPKNPDKSNGPPVLWRRKHGSGRLVVRNDEALLEKQNRGQLLQMILASMPVAAVPLVNAKVYFVDDCPQPMWDVLKEPIKTEFNMTDTDFYRNVWWPDMMALSKEFGVKYTFVLVFSYDDKVEGGFTADPFYSHSGKGAPAFMAREAVALGHEVGLHGYNHQSLVTEAGGPTSVGWPNQTAMVDGLNLARAEWARLFGSGNMPFTYIAPNNHIQRVGKEAVRAAFPEIRVMATQYLDQAGVEGGEWDTDPDVAQFVGMPRVASEFYVGTRNNVAFHDAIMLAGIWTHFSHPDDMYDPARNGGMGWAQLREAQRAMFTHVRDDYPWLRSMTARDAYHEIVRYRTDPFEVEIRGDKAVVHLGSGSKVPRWFQLRVDPAMRAEGTTTALLRQAYPEYGVYMFEGVGPEAVVQLVAPGT